MQLILWYLGFNPVMEAPKSCSVRVKLPGLPLEFWTHKALRAIGNSIGSTKYIDPGIVGASDKRIAWLLVEVDFAGGLPGDVDLLWNQRRHKQCIDYWGIPFQCLICHRTGHLRDHCPLRHKLGKKGKNKERDRYKHTASGNLSIHITGNSCPISSDEGDEYVSANDLSDSTLLVVDGGGPGYFSSCTGHF